MHGDEIAFIFGGEKILTFTFTFFNLHHHHQNHLMHEDEIAEFYIFMIFFADPFKPKPEALIDYTDEERTLSRTMMTFWANFAKTG